MKNYLLCLNLLITFIIMFLFGSCSSDSSFEDSASFESKMEIDKYGGIVKPSNPKNPYDSLGRLHDSLLSNSNKNNYKQATTELLNAITINNNKNVFEIIKDSGISATAKLSFTTYITNLLDLVAKKQNYETIYHFIVDYETSVLTNSNLTKKDKEIILKSSSIARYITYAYSVDPPTKDPDWSILITGLVITDKVETLLAPFNTEVEFHQ